MYASFYRELASSVSGFVSIGANSVLNIDTYVYSSMQGTLESIRAVILSGRINDGYALLRKYFDAAVINIYSDLFLRDNFSFENFVVKKIDDWIQGKDTLPEYRVMSQYIKTSETLKPISDVFSMDERYKRIRDRCNDHTHYNFYRNVLLNDNEIYLKDRALWLSRLSEDARDIFVFHLGYVFFMNDHYMASNDYLDALECGLPPEEKSQYWVAPFIQSVFNEIITPSRPEISDVIKAVSAMELS